MLAAGQLHQRDRGRSGVDRSARTRIGARQGTSCRNTPGSVAGGERLPGSLVGAERLHGVAALI